MTWAEITAWNVGRRIQLAGLLVGPWLHMLSVVMASVMTAEEQEARKRLGGARFEYWVRAGAEAARSETPAS
jgi:hypothetical protein